MFFIKLHNKNIFKNKKKLNWAFEVSRHLKETFKNLGFLKPYSKQPRDRRQIEAHG